MLQCITSYYNALHHITMHYIMLQCITSCYNDYIMLHYITSCYIRWSRLWVGLPTTGTWTALRTTCSRSTRERTWTELSTTPRVSCIMRKLAKNFWVHVTLVPDSLLLKREEERSLALSLVCMWCLSGEKTKDRNMISSPFLSLLLLFSLDSSFPREWIKGSGYPDGIQRNEELSPRDKEHVKRLYGPPKTGVTVDPTPTTTPTTRTTTGITSLEPNLCAPPREKQSGEPSQISWASICFCNNVT